MPSRPASRRRDDPLAHLYPELAAGGFTRVDGTIAFYARVNAVLEQLGPEATVLDFGAGRGGAHSDDQVSFRRGLRNLRGKAGSVIGVDVDEAVLGNPALDEARVIASGERLPVGDDSIDLIVSDFVFEHLADPGWAASELDRVLRSGGWLTVRTPNRWGYIALGNRLVPGAAKDHLLRFLQPSRASDDVFPTTYQLNTGRALRRWFPTDRYDSVVYAADSEPAYFGGSAVAARATRFVSKLTPSSFRSVLYAYLQKR